MSVERIVASMLADASKPAEAKAARAAWARARCAALRAAMRAMNDKCMEAVERLSEEEFERLCDAEEAKVAAIRAQIDAVIDDDRWPRELYFGGI